MALIPDPVLPLYHSQETERDETSLSFPSC